MFFENALLCLQLMKVQVVYDLNYFDYFPLNISNNVVIKQIKLSKCGAMIFIRNNNTNIKIRMNVKIIFIDNFCNLNTNNLSMK